MDFTFKLSKEYQFDTTPYNNILKEYTIKTAQKEEQLLKESLIHLLGRMPSIEEIKKNLTRIFHTNRDIEYQYNGITILINEGIKSENNSVFTQWKTIKPVDKSIISD